MKSGNTERLTETTGIGAFASFSRVKCDEHHPLL